MSKIGMAARAMNDIHLSGGQQFDIAFSQIVGMHRNKVLIESAALLQMLDRGTETAVGHFAFAALEPVEHFAAAMREHFELQRRLRHMHAQTPPLPARSLTA